MSPVASISVSLPSAARWSRWAPELLDNEGLTVPGSEGWLKTRGDQRDSQLAVARLARELDLDIEPSTSDRVAGFQQIPIGTQARMGMTVAEQSSN